MLHHLALELADLGLELVAHRVDGRSKISILSLGANAGSTREGKGGFHHEHVALVVKDNLGRSESIEQAQDFQHAVTGVIACFHT